MTHAVSVQGLNSGQESQPPQDTGSNAEVDHRVLGGNLMLQCLVKLIANCKFLTQSFCMLAASMDGNVLPHKQTNNEYGDLRVDDAECIQGSYSLGDRSFASRLKSGHTSDTVDLLVRLAWLCTT